jgi:GNAT superfamily N-acetyltransferase
VLPAHIGCGVGARLLDHAVVTLRAEGVRVLRIASDQHAEGFYLAMGARRVGEVASTPCGRTLPLLVIEVSGR